MANEDMYLELGEAIAEQCEGKTREEQARIIAASIRRVSEMYKRALGALDAIEGSGGDDAETH